MIITSSCKSSLNMNHGHDHHVVVVVVVVEVVEVVVVVLYHNCTNPPFNCHHRHQQSRQ